MIRRILRFSWDKGRDSWVINGIELVLQTERNVGIAMIEDGKWVFVNQGCHCQFTQVGTFLVKSVLHHESSFLFLYARVTSN